MSLSEGKSAELYLGLELCVGLQKDEIVMKISAPSEKVTVGDGEIWVFKYNETGYVTKGNVSGSGALFDPYQIRSSTTANSYELLIKLRFDKKDRMTTWSYTGNYAAFDTPFHLEGRTFLRRNGATGKYWRGTLERPDGEKYVGEWKGEKRHGQGTWTLPDAGRYVGEFRDHQPNGQGRFTWTDGQEYVGGYKDSKKNGQGTYTWPDGRKYVGTFKDNKMNGQGTMTKSDGTQQSGRWKDDVYQGP